MKRIGYITNKLFIELNSYLFSTMPMCFIKINLRKNFLVGFFILLSLSLYSQVSEDDIMELSLKDLMNIEVLTSSKKPQKVKDSFSNINIITHKQIQDYGFSTLAEALDFIHGFYISNDRNYTIVGVRGLLRPSEYGNRILLMINGHVLNENVYGSAFMDNTLGLDIRMIQRIEVIHGPGSSVYGSNAFMAVVNVVTMGRTGSELSFGTGNFSHYQGSAAFQDSLENENYIQVTGNYLFDGGENFNFKEFNTPDNNFGLSQNRDKEEAFGFYGIMNSFDWQFSGMAISRIKQIGTGQWETALLGKTFGKDERQFLNGSKKWTRSNSSLFANFSIDRYKYSGRYEYIDEKWFDASNGEWYTGSVNYNYFPNDKHHLLLGTDVRYNRWSDYLELLEDSVIFYKNNPFWNVCAYAQYDYSISNNLQLNTGIRFDYYDFLKPNYSPRIGLKYNPSKDVQIKFSYNRAFRAPTFYEMFYEASDENIKNLDLKSEVIDFYELNTEYLFKENINAGISFYLFQMSDIIEPVDINGLIQHQNFANSRSSGVDAYLNFVISTYVSGRVSYSFQNFEMKENIESERYNSPTSIFKAAVRGRIPEFGNLAFVGQYQTERYTLDGSKTNPYFIVNLNYRSIQIMNHFFVNLKVQNLFDTEYYNPVNYDFVQNSIIQPSRRFILGIQYIF